MLLEGHFDSISSTMQWPLLFSAFALFAGLFLAPVSLQAKDPKLKAIFDGKSLRGWKQCNGKASYEVSGQMIIGTTAEGSPNSFLCTEKEYANFILELEVQVDPRLNSGIQVRSHIFDKDTVVMVNQDGTGKNPIERKMPAGRVHGYQVEIATEASGASGSIYDEARRGWLDLKAKDPAASKAFKDNAWNHYRIEARGNNIKTFVNGVPVANLTDDMDKSGFIALQVHSFKGDTPAKVKWRNIRLAELP